MREFRQTGFLTHIWKQNVWYTQHVGTTTHMVFTFSSAQTQLKEHHSLCFYCGSNPQKHDCTDTDCEVGGDPTSLAPPKATWTSFSFLSFFCTLFPLFLLSYVFCLLLLLLSLSLFLSKRVCGSILCLGFVAEWLPRAPAP